MSLETVSIHDLIDVITTTLDARDHGTMEHSFRVAAYAEVIAADMALGADAQWRVHVAAHLHDIGKIGVPDHVLRKTGPLTDEEMAAMREHAVFGYRILKRLAALERISRIVRHHHERYDGQGYPDGLKGEAIPLESRIIAVADAFDAMTAGRPYRPALAWSEAVEEVARNAGTQFCPMVARHFRRVSADLPPSAAPSGESRKLPLVDGVFPAGWIMPRPVFSGASGGRGTAAWREFRETALEKLAGTRWTKWWKKAS